MSVPKDREARACARASRPGPPIAGQRAVIVIATPGTQTLSSSV